MDTAMKERFMALWEKFFDGAELPLVFFYSNRDTPTKQPKPPDQHRCVIADIWRTRKGRAISLDANAIGCDGGRKYLGFGEIRRPHFEYFLSCGIPGVVEGERYKKTPQIVKKVMAAMPKFTAPAKVITFKRWDLIEEKDEPEAVIFFAPPDVLAGLFTLANFDTVESGVFTPFCSGCAAIVTFPYMEREAYPQRAVIGMFDVSARPCVPAGILSFAVPLNRFKVMVDNMEESFLITGSWAEVRKRIAASSRK